MFKSTFVKYLTTFIIILSLSFIILSSIITTTMNSRMTEEREVELSNMCEALSRHISSTINVEDIETFVKTPVPNLGIGIIMKLDSNIKILLTDPDGKIVLTTTIVQTENGVQKPAISSDLGYFNIEDCKPVEDEDGNITYSYIGTPENSKIAKDNIQACAMPIITNDVNIGYAVALVSTETDNETMMAVRKSILNSTLWVLLAAAVALYLITERMTAPLKNMTSATKSFAKGDFSARVTISGNDEIAELGEAFNSMAESLDSLEKMRNSFLANVSHDLRTPMTTISGFIDGITSGAIPPEKHDYYLRIISDEVHRLSRLVSDLLDISRLESGEKKFNFCEFDIAEMARIILISFEKQIEEKNLDVIFEVTSEKMIVIGDKDSIHQVLYNLMHNAIKFSKPGGKFAITISAYNKKTRVSVYDEGESIEKEELSLVFDRFYKTDKSRGLDKNGVGLGLYICKTIIDAHGEEIHAESPGNNGAEFWFTLKEGTGTAKGASFKEPK